MPSFPPATRTFPSDNSVSVWYCLGTVVSVVAVNVPARMLIRPLSPHTAQDWLLPLFALFATVGSLALARWATRIQSRLGEDP